MQWVLRDSAHSLPSDSDSTQPTSSVGIAASQTALEVIVGSVTGAALALQSRRSTLCYLRTPGRSRRAECSVAYGISMLSRKR